MKLLQIRNECVPQYTVYKQTHTTNRVQLVFLCTGGDPVHIARKPEWDAALRARGLKYAKQKSFFRNTQYTNTKHIQYKYGTGRGVHVAGKPERRHTEPEVSGVTVKFTAVPTTMDPFSILCFCVCLYIFVFLFVFTYTSQPCSQSYPSPHLLVLLNHFPFTISF